MNTFMIIASVFAFLAAALHVLIAYMEMFAWEGPLARKTFGGTPESARPFAFFAYNQGLYNSFLAIEVFVGLGILFFSSVAVGSALVLAGTASMLCAALGLVLKDNSFATASAKQGSLPLLAVIFMVLGLVL
ncbi:DUF1304 domain-containing protein [Alloscardovia macacae]|nr:DUF1304 domain-containing protein [Alloscardovia macacae]